ncbi:peptidase C14 caspase catalytic subunit p20 [Tolypothrix sp. NIES-4075]|uniref:caspase family protein n=1 Tax=Tolypothrix sp. NIES-4075 TaxID=2005459 RepID=UPI000B5CEB66|nr:caspase family protein [Tolypothrix sp. NIES-4075]GAX45518.1 peptidase C14 caspase catalytic subunit p20 [Tolypothrix sp. NIES-4075]
MPQFKRRHFLQSTGSLLAALGLSQLDIQRRGNEYGRVLAQNTRRKLALLVGINQYGGGVPSLRGCVNDTDLQKQLLINKFAFDPKDILIVNDAQATRHGILTAFEEHLIKQAKPDDVVVFHFSGHGSQVVDPDRDSPDGLNSSFLPVDRRLASGFPDKGGVVNDIMGHTLFLLMSALQTENVTAVLDCCYAGGGTRGNFAVRSAGANYVQASPEELEYQHKWLSRLNISHQEFIRRRKAGIAKGVVIAGAKREQLACDAAFDNFYAGAFTYNLTQYLWQQTRNEPLGTVMVNVGRSLKQFAREQGNLQDLQFEVKPNSDNDKRSVYLVEQQTPPAEAVIVGVEGDRAQVWLGGVNQESLKAFEKGAVLEIIDPKGKQKGLVELESRSGLKGQGKLSGIATLGTLLQEQVRGIPNDVSLIIGLDPSLGKDTEAARQALQAMRRIEAVPLLQTEVQYILGRMTDAYYKDFQRLGVKNIPAIDSVGLFTPSLEVIPNSFVAPGESVTQAITRLQPKFKSLLAARLVKLTLNTDSSRLNVTASMSRQDGKELVASTFPVRGSIGKASPNQPVPKLSTDVSKLPLGTQVQFQITNNENRDLYLSILVIDPAGEMSIIFPNQWTVADDVTRVKAREKLSVPDISDRSFSLVTQEPLGVAEVLIIASATPLRSALQALRDIASRGGNSRGAITPNEPTQVIGNLLNDLAEGTRSTGISVTQTPRLKRIDTSQMAAMSITFEVI